MFDPQQAITAALDKTTIIDNDLLSQAVRQQIDWHDPIAVELNRRLTEPLLKHFTEQELQSLLDTQDVSTVINDALGKMLFEEH